MPDGQILETKLVGPDPHPLAVDRGRALDWLDARVADGSVVISSLPGSGRLELLARWAVGRSGHPTTWLRLDAWDDLRRLARHLVAALRRVDERIGADVLDELSRGMAVQRDIVLPALAADCAAHADPFTLVIHGVDRVVDPLAIGALRAVQRYRPDNLRLIWLSDDDGPADFQTADGVTHVPHIDPGLLAFTVDEVAEMYRRIDVEATAEQVAELARATDGWPLAALHGVETAQQAGEFVPFDPADRTLVARIDRTVVSRLPPELRPIASDLAVLGSVTAPQLEAMTDRSDAVDGLHRLARRHVIVRQDDRWAVATPLKEHLRAEREAHDAPAAVILRRRRARSAADSGDAGRALDRLVDTGDLEARARLLLERHRQWSADGDHAVEEHAIAALVHAPAQAELHLVRAWYEVFNAADPETAATYVDSVERIPLDGARAIRAHSEIEFLRAVLARRAGRLADSAAHARAGIEIGEPLVSAPERELADWPYLAVVPTTASLYLGHFLFHAGEVGLARDELLRANASREWSEPALAALHGVLGVIGWLEDDPSARIHGAIAASNLGDRINSSNHLAAVALALTGSGPDASEMADRYRHDAPAIDEPTAEVFGHLVGVVHGDATEAERSYAAARRAVEGCPQPGVLSAALARAGSLLDRPDDSPELGQPLTDSERRVLLALRGDLTERDIAAELHLSHNTVRAYRRRGYRKLGVTSRAAAVAKLAELDLDQP